MVDIDQSGVQVREPDSEARLWAMIAHLSGFLGYFLPVIGSLIGPLIVWQLKKDLHPYVDEQGKEALNFQITVLIAAMVCVLLMLIVLTVFVSMLISLIRDAFKNKK